MPRYQVPSSGGGGGGSGGGGGGIALPQKVGSGAVFSGARQVEFIGSIGVVIEGNDAQGRITFKGAQISPLTSYIAVKTRQSVINLHGGLLSLSTGDALDSVPTDINVTTGIGKLMIVVNAGSDLAGDITVTGTTVDRETGAETGADTDTITVDAVTTDGSDTDASGNARYAFTGAYITSKWFKGAVVLSTADLTLTDVDVYHVSFEQANDATAYEIDTFDVNAFSTSSSAWLYGYLYSLVVTGDKCDIVREASLELPAADVAADRYYRLRRGNVGKVMDGSSDGLWADLFLGPLAQTYWEDITIKIWLRDIFGSL